jgi:membrane fusion protein (multidrug efflux system)
MVAQRDNAEAKGQNMDGDSARAPGAVAADKVTQRPTAKRPRRARFVVFALVVLAAATAGGAYWLHARNFETTDDAFIDGNIAVVAPRIAGQIERVLVADNQAVRAGDPLVEIDPRDLRIKLRQAQAQRANAAAQLAEMRARAEMQQASVDQAAADARVSEADLAQAQQDFTRYRNINPQAITRQQLDNATATLRSAQARLEARRQAVSAAQAQAKSAQAQILGAEAALQEADVAVANAELQLSYTGITAPVDGRVTRRTAVAGNYVSAGTALLSLVPDDLWVTANFKETQLARMRPGQPVEIDVDAVPDTVFHGHVDSFQAGTGSAFATLPAENATGNYVKVVQRVPVKIVFDGPRPDGAGPRLSPGMSVSPRVTVR